MNMNIYMNISRLLLRVQKYPLMLLLRYCNYNLRIDAYCVLSRRHFILAKQSELPSLHCLESP